MKEIISLSANPYISFPLNNENKTNIYVKRAQAQMLNSCFRNTEMLLSVVWLIVDQVLDLVECHQEARGAFSEIRGGPSRSRLVEQIKVAAWRQTGRLTTEGPLVLPGRGGEFRQLLQPQQHLSLQHQGQKHNAV